MRRSFIYLAIFSLFFWVSWGTLAYLTSPINEQGQTNSFAVTAFFVLFFGGVTMLATLVTGIIKNYRPNRKLPHLLIKDSLTQGFIIGTWVTGLLVLQLLRSATIINLILWILILISVQWFIARYQKPKY
jgi:hypothetical protein